MIVLLQFGCSDSPTEIESKTNLIARSWKGEEYFLISFEDTTSRGKDLVETLEFRKDGSYFFYKFSMSSMGIVGYWKLEENGKLLRLSKDDTHSELFSITELNSTSFVIGDTNSRGYKLFPK